MSDLRASVASFIAGRDGTSSLPKSDMPTQYSDHQVVFHHEFTLGGSPEVYPPGQYAIETAERVHEQNAKSARVLTSTVLIVPTSSGTRAVQVKPSELAAALDADVRRHELGAPSEHPDRGNAENPEAEVLKSDSVESQLDRYGIERVPADVFVWQGYRYTNASDAVAAAIRAKTA